MNRSSDLHQAKFISINWEKPFYLMIFNVVNNVFFLTTFIAWFSWVFNRPVPVRSVWFSDLKADGEDILTKSSKDILKITFNHMAMCIVKDVACSDKPTGDYPAWNFTVLVQCQQVHPYLYIIFHHYTCINLLIQAHSFSHYSLDSEDHHWLGLFACPLSHW